MANLWSKEIPYNNGELDFVPSITEYIVKDSKQAVVVFPGGGYVSKAEHEGRVIGEWFLSHGITSFVVDYRVAPYKHPAQISDGIRAVKYVRHNAKKWGIEKIYVMGFSAGAHLAGSVSVHYDKEMYAPTDKIDKENARPDGSILCYPVIDMLEYRHDGSRQNLLGPLPTPDEKDMMSLYKQVNADTPKAFLWHTSDDGSVPVQNSLLYANALANVRVPFELHIYPHGHHGLGLSPDNKYAARWSEELLRWLDADIYN